MIWWNKLKTVLLCDKDCTHYALREIIEFHNSKACYKVKVYHACTKRGKIKFISKTIYKHNWKEATSNNGTILTYYQRCGYHQQ